MHPPCDRSPAPIARAAPRTAGTQVVPRPNARDSRTDYQHIEGFARQIAKKPASLDLTDLPEGYGFQFEVKMTDTTENESKPILDQVVLTFK